MLQKPVLIVHIPPEYTRAIYMNIIENPATTPTTSKVSDQLWLAAPAVTTACPALALADALAAAVT
jgi:hypothetical protein